MPIDKPQLVKDCIKNRKKAQEVLFDLYRNKLFGICLRYAKDEDDAKDILQESFIKIFSQLKNLSNPEALDSWVRQTTIRTAINYYHKNLKNKNTIEAEEIEIQNQDYLNIISKISNEELVKVINLLPDGYRVVFNLYVVDGYSHKEIAEQLGVSENTSKSQLRSAKLKLKEMLDKIGVSRYERAI